MEQNQQQQEQINKPSAVPFIIVGILLVGIVGYVVVSATINRAQNQMQSKRENEQKSFSLSSSLAISPTPTQIPYPTKGNMVLKTPDGATRFPVGQPVTVTFEASSSEEKIVGYDVVLSYNIEAFDRSEIKNEDSSFKVFTYDRDGRVLVSAVKDLQATNVTSWSNHALFTYVFTPKQKGTFQFSLKPFGQETSKLVNEKAEAAYPQYNDLTLEIY